MCVQREHQKREAERLECFKQKATVMKLINKLAKPTKTVITDNSISLTIDRNKKLHGEVCFESGHMGRCPTLMCTPVSDVDC
jgi:hypothetical protein